MRNKHLTYDQRYSIEMMLKAKVQKKIIYQTLKIPESTFYRELKRNSKKRSYNANFAHMLADELKRDCNLKTRLTSSMIRLIEIKLKSSPIIQEPLPLMYPFII